MQFWLTRIHHVRVIGLLSVLACLMLVCVSVLMQGKIRVFTRANKQIVFIESSNKSALTARQACAVESAAKHNPTMTVSVYLTSPSVDLITSKVMRALASISNVKFVKLDLRLYLKGTKLEKWYTADEWRKSDFRVVHLSDALRLVVLHKNGGIYLDLDVVVLKSLDDLNNCAGREDSTKVGNAVLAFDKGHAFLEAYLEKFVENYNGKCHDCNGPQLLTHVSNSVCANNTLANVTADWMPTRCMGVTEMPQEAFYAVHWTEWRDFFNSANPQTVLGRTNGSYVTHMWNEFSAKENVTIGSGQAYELLAKKHCPSVYKAILDDGSF